MATANPKMSDKTEREDEEMQLKAELWTMLEENKAMLEVTWKITKQAEQEQVHDVQQVREKSSRNQREQQASHLNAEKTTTKQEAGLCENCNAVKTENEQLKTENNQLKQQMEALITDANENKTSTLEHGSELEELELLRRRISEQNEELKQMKEQMQKEKERLKRRLEDESVAAQRMAFETQLRQLNEFQSLTNEMKEWKETLVTELQRQQLLQPATAAEKHHSLSGRPNY